MPVNAEPLLESIEGHIAEVRLVPCNPPDEVDYGDFV